MDTLFLASFIFGAAFTLVSVALGAASHLPGGHLVHAGDAPGHGPGHADGGPPTPGAASGHGPIEAVGQSPGHARGPHGVPLFSLSSLLASLTWFGATGYLLLRFGGWPLVLALPAALLAGVAGWLLLASFLARVLAGERAMDPRDYRLDGTVARVSVGIPSQGVGEIVFAKAGGRRSEAARGLGGRPIPRGAEVLILDYARGVAVVQPWAEAMADREPQPAGLGPPRSVDEGGG